MSAPTRGYPQVKSFKTVRAFRERLATLGLDLPVDDDVEAGADAPLSQPLTVGGRTIGNRFAVLPMEGWDATADGMPTDLVERRWRRFGRSGAKLIWGGEAVAVRADGRANPRQLLLDERSAGALSDLRLALLAEHEEATGSLDDLVVGLQLTHSGRWSRPAGDPAPRPARRDPALDARLGVTDDASVVSDDELDELVESFATAGRLASEAGFDFVDLKACHGYLGHELLSRYAPGRYGGPTLADRSRFHLAIIDAVRSAAPDLLIGVRLSAFDVAPHEPGRDAVGTPAPAATSVRRFGADDTGLAPDLTEPSALIDAFAEAGVTMVCVTAGSPYYNPHVQRPAYFPPSDGYLPPEDPLVGVVRLIDAATAVKAHRPDLLVVGSGYSYLQEWIAHVAQPQVRAGHVDSIGVGRMALSYPELPLDVLAGRPLSRRHLCRTFSDCTTAPRHGLVSGCYPLDEFYKNREERVQLAAIKREIRHRAPAPTPGDDDG